MKTQFLLCAIVYCFLGSNLVGANSAYASGWHKISLTSEQYRKISTAYNGTAFVFSPRKLRWYAYRNGRLIKSGRASGGKHYCRDVGRRCLTPRGHFRVYSRGNAHCRSSKFPLGRGGAPMPYCTFFYKGFAIHGSPDVPNYNASHGCIRVKPAAARWLHHNFFRHGLRVIVTSY